MTAKKRLSFSRIEFEDIQEIVDIQEVIDYAVFDDWFQFDYPLTQEEAAFLDTLLQRNIRFVDTYLEEELKAQFIIPLLNKVDFFYHDARGWYERRLKGTVNGVVLQGETDYMVARGIEKPHAPYFFLQEYKKEFGSRHPKNPLLAEMLVAMQLNGDALMRGAYVIGKSWTFMLLKQRDTNRYEYYRSQDFNVLKTAELQGIYINLQAIKALL